MGRLQIDTIVGRSWVPILTRKPAIHTHVFLVLPVQTDGTAFFRVRVEIFHTRPNRPFSSPSLLHNEYRIIAGGVKRPRRGADHPPPSSAEIEERVEVHLYSACWPSWPVLGWTLPLTLPFTSKFIVQNMCSVTYVEGKVSLR